MVSRNLCSQKNYFPETILTTPLLETVKAETDVVVSFLATKSSGRESQMSLRVKADVRLHSQRCAVHASGFRWNRMDLQWFNKMLTNAFIEGLFCARHFLVIITLGSTGRSPFYN